MITEEKCNNAIGVLRFIVDESEYKNSVFEFNGEKYDAIEILEQLIEEHFNNSVDKTTPKLIKHGKYYDEITKELEDGYYCPHCNSFVDKMDSFCCSCGQALDWSDKK